VKCVSRAAAISGSFRVMNGKMNQITAQTSLIKEVVGSMQIALSKARASLIPLIIYIIFEEFDLTSNYLNVIKISACSSSSPFFYNFELIYDEPSS
jgi:hypothetical protein